MDYLVGTRAHTTNPPKKAMPAKKNEKPAEKPAKQEAAKKTATKKNAAKQVETKAKTTTKASTTTTASAEEPDVGPMTDEEAVKYVKEHQKRSRDEESTGEVSDEEGDTDEVVYVTFGFTPSGKPSASSPCGRSSRTPSFATRFLGAAAKSISLHRAIMRVSLHN